jgi:hypothetical protein
MFLFLALISLEGDELPQVVIGKDGMEMVLVPEGSFIIGSDGEPDEKLQRTIRLPAFYIDRYEVSNAQYARFVKETGYPSPPHWNGTNPPPGSENLPVTNVTWFDAMCYAIWAGKRLPTEAEWEKAGRGTDGRLFPWGNEDNPKARNLSTDKLAPVDSYKEGVSPYGCYNMAGNVWEWTADWYEAYPGSGAKSPHFGEKYKVVKGGGAFEFYPIPNTGRLSQRARCLPYGFYEGLGFRCVKDVNPNQAPYDPKALLEEAKRVLKHPLPPPSPLSYEREFKKYLREGFLPIKIQGMLGEEGYVRVGVPFPRGLLRDFRNLRLSSSAGKIRPFQARALSFWDDGSISWVLLDFEAKAGEVLKLNFLNKRSLHLPNEAITFKEGKENILISNGKFVFLISKEPPFLKIKGLDGKEIVDGLEMSFVLKKEGKDINLLPLPSEEIEKEEIGPLHSVFRLRGRFGAADGWVSPFTYDMRVHLFLRSEKVRFSLTITNYSKREREPALVSSGNFLISLNGKISRTIFGADGKEIGLDFKKKVELLQEGAYGFRMDVDGRRKGEGKRADGWLKVNSGRKNLYLGVKYFWQNHPIALVSQNSECGFSIFNKEEPFEWEGGLAKTFDFYLTISENGNKQPPNDSLVGIIPPSWIAGTKSLDDLLPRGEETLRFFPYWEAIMESSARRWERGMATGIRDFGDAYYGGPYKGKNSYANLEYDVPLNFLIQFVRTGKKWYLDVAEMQVRHQADIDIDHFTGRQWKHSPQHTTTEADLGHIFLRGLLLHYLLRGERRSLEAAEEIGKWLAPQVERLEGMGNERQIGWSLFALSELFKVTRKDEYLKAAEKAALKLAQGQLPTGRFNIRWDNRISFMNGIAMAGLLGVYLNSKREEIYQAILKLAYRTLGFYPEYACRTLDALSWLAEKTKDSRFWNLIERTWETSMEFLIPRDALSAGTFSWKFLHFAGKYRFPLYIKESAKLDPESWRFLRLKGEKIEIDLQGEGEVLIVLEGLNEGKAILYNSKGAIVKQGELRGEKLFKSVNFKIDKGKWRVVLLGGESAIWEVHYDKRIIPTIYDPSFSELANIYPRANCVVKEGARQIRIKLKAKGEGFHKALIYDPKGRLAGAVEKFIDLGDENTYEMEVKVEVGKSIKKEGWGIEIYNCEVTEVEGLSPFLYTSL